MLYANIRIYMCYMSVGTDWDTAIATATFHELPYALNFAF